MMTSPKSASLTPDVTVIVPVYNRQGMLKDCLAGLAAQDYPADRMELIVVDGASSEPLQEVVEAFATSVDFPVRYLRKLPDKGPVSKRNHAASYAQGRILVFTDSDCRPVPGWLTAGMAAFGEDRVGFASGPVTYKPEQTKTAFSKLTAETWEEHPTYPTANMFYRRDLFVEFGGFDTQLAVRDLMNRATECADTDLAWRIRKAGWLNRFQPEALIYHEVEQLTPFQWIMEPTRLILLPLLIRLHPEIAPKLLTGNLVFYIGSVAVWISVLLGLGFLLFAPALLWLFPLGLLGLGLRKARSLQPGKLARGLYLVSCNILRMGVLALTLVAGSFRYGRLVL